MKSYEFNVFNVGQGLCTVLKGIKENDENYFAIFDCGTIQAGAFSTERIVDTVVSMANQKGKIDGIVISHQDMDHWSMLLDIIWKYYDVKGEYVVCKDLFYFRKTRDKTYIYEKNKSLIEYSYNYTGTECSLNFETAVLGDGNIWEIYAYAEYNENPDLGQCCFKLEGNYDSGELAFCIFIDRVWVDKGNIIYDRRFTVESGGMAFTEGNWQAVVNCIEENKIYDKVTEAIGFQRYFRAHYNDFLSQLRQISFRYKDMEQELSRETNFRKDKNPIGTILLGGNFWEIGYTRLYGILKKLVDTGLVEQVNDTAESGDPVKLCGLLRMDEDTFQHDISLEEIFIDENLLDPFSALPTAGTPAVLHNASSLIVEFTVQEKDYLLFPGDATVHDFADLAKKLAGREDSDTLLTAPHHGSDHTNYCTLPDGGTQPLILMLESLKTGGNIISSCVVSALASKFGHPGERFKNDILNYVYDDRDDKHMACYVKDGRKYEFETCRQFFCTENFKNMSVEWYADEEDLSPRANRALHINGGFI